MVRNWTMINLMKINYDAGDGELRLELNDNTYTNKTIIISNNVLMFKISNTPGEMECPFIVDLMISEFQEDIIEKLQMAGYDWHEIEELNRIYYLHAEGGIVLEVYSLSEFQIIS